MEIKQRTYGLRIAATEAAFARNAEFGPIPLRSFHPRTRPREAIGEMNKSEIELGRWGSRSFFSGSKYASSFRSRGTGM